MMKFKRPWGFAHVLAAFLFPIVCVLIFFAVRGPITLARAAEARDPDVASAELIQRVFRRVVVEVLPSVVEVNTVKEGERGDDRSLPWKDYFHIPGEEVDPPRFEQRGQGSGVIVAYKNDSYYVLTNAHVIGEAEGIQLELHDGELIDGVLVGRDERKDLALISFRAQPSRYPVARLGDSDELYVGDWVLAFGSPYGYERSVSSGIVSALSRRDGPDGNINDFIQTDAAINQGNSGGALVNIHGEVVGINSFITTSHGGNIGLGFAIPVNNVKKSIRQLIAAGEVSYGWLGVSVGEYDPAIAQSLGYEGESGALVYQLFKDSPADSAGLRPGDFIWALDGRAVETADELIYRIGDMESGRTTELSVSRMDKTLTLQVKIGKRKDEAEVFSRQVEVWPGFVVVPLTEELRERMEISDEVQGIPVREVHPHSASQAAGLQTGDLIRIINDRPVGSLAELYHALGDPDERLKFSIWRDGMELELEQPPTNKEN